MDVATWLQGVGLERHEAVFRDNLIDMDVVRELTENDLEKLGLALGDRKRIMKAIASLPALGTAPPTLIGAAPRTRDEAERRPVTVMFCDLVGSTGLAATLDAEDWRDLVRAYLDNSAEAVTQYGGHVAKRLGDGLMALFGYPRAQENDAERAARAGLAILRALVDLNAANAGRKLPKLAARIGLDSGPVVVDSAGEVFGDAPNIAARVQSAAEPGTMLVTATVRRQVAGLFIVEEKGPHELKGVPGAPTLYRIARASGGGRRAVARAYTPLIGREEDLRVLLKRWERARAGEGQFILIVGEPGLGKSRLVEEFRNRLAEAPHSWLDWTASQLLQNTALHPLTEWGKQRFGADLSPERRLADLEASLTQVKLNPAEFAPLLAPLLDIVVEWVGAPELTPEELRRRQLAAMAAWMLAGARAQPLVLAFEDLHWADPTSLNLLKTLAERGATAPLMIVATARPEFRAPWATRSHHGVISLAPLDAGQVRQMVGTMAESHALSADAVEGVAVRTGGVPLFIEEVTRLMLEGGAHAIPPTLQQSLAARLDRLGEAREIAQTGAVIGREFTFGLLSAITGLPEAALNAALEKLLDADLLFVDGIAPDATYRFKHALIQEAAYESMLRSKRREIHAEIASSLARLQPAIVETAPETLATHLARAGDAAGAAEYWRRAGSLAQRNSAYQEAIGAYQNALQHISKEDRAFVDINRALASVYFAAGDHDLNLKHLEEAVAAAEASGDPVTMTEIGMQQCHVLSQYGGDPTGAVRIGRRALEMANSLEDESLAYGARFALAHASWIGGDYDSVTELLSANLPENMRDPTQIRDFGTAGSLLVDSMSILGEMLAHRGHFDRAFAILERAQALPQKNAFDTSILNNHHARAHLFRGDANSAAPMLRAAIEHACRVGLEFTLPWHQALLGHAYALDGELETAVPLLEAALERSQEIHLPYLTSSTGARLGETLAPLEPKRALDVAETALGVARASGHRAMEAELLRVKAASLLSLDAEAAEAAAREGYNLAERLGLGPEQGHGFRILGDILAAKGDAIKAEELHGLARAQYRRLGMTRWAEGPRR